MEKRIFIRIKDNQVYADQARELCAKLADYYLQRFNEVSAGEDIPEGYLSKADCMRDCQYLCEYFKIRQFELSSNVSLHW